MRHTMNNDSNFYDNTMSKSKKPMTPKFYENDPCSVYSYDYCNDIRDKIYYSTGDNNLRNDMLQYNSTVEANFDLVGDIQDEWSIEDKSLIQRLEQMMCKHITAFTNKKVIRVSTIPTDTLRPPWINYMRPNEYNPPHHHSGFFSFVWYLDIPEEIRQEWKKQRGSSAKRGCIQFFSQVMPKQHMTFNPKTNDLFVFDSGHNHQVYPFYSDNTRISLAGNVYQMEVSNE